MENSKRPEQQQQLEEDATRNRVEHVDKLRARLESLDSKTPQEHEIQLELDHESGVATICIRSGARDALSGRMISQLSRCLEQLERWSEGRAVLLLGHGSTFCSGSDLVSARASADEQLGAELAELMQDTIMRIQRLPMVSLAFIEGYALGGGAELALATDLRLMTASAKIGFIHARVAVCCGWGGGSRLVHLVGPARAADLLLSGRVVGAPEAQQLGLVNGLAADRSGALAYLRAHLVAPKVTLKAIKSMLNGARTLPTFADSLIHEGALFAFTWGRPEHLAAIDRNMKHND